MVGNPEDRRRFLSKAPAVLAGLAAAPGSALLSPAEGTGAGIIDTHTHFYDPTRPQGVPWPPKEDAFLYRRVMPPEFEQLARPLDVTDTVVVEASAWEEDNQWVLDLARREPVITGLVGHLKPGRPGFGEFLARFSRDPLFRGIRTGLWDVKVEPEDGAFVEDLRELARRGLTLDLLVGPDQLPVAAELARRVPDLVMVIDHCANVRIDGGPPPAGWLDGIRAAARHPKIHMKMSGLVEGTGRADGQAPRETAFYRQILDAIWDAFGEERLLFGSNWPVSARFADYATVLRIVREYLADRGARAAERCLQVNALRVYGLRRR